MINHGTLIESEKCNWKKSEVLTAIVSGGSFGKGARASISRIIDTYVFDVAPRLRSRFKIKRP
jgi:hypothetical protein